MAVAEEAEAGTDERDAAVLVDDRQRKALTAERAELPDPAQECLVALEAPEGDVLAVVGRRGRIALTLGERLDGTAQRRPRLVERDLGPGVHQAQRGREAGQAPSYDHCLHNSADATILSLVGSDSRGGPANTSKPA